MQVRDLAKDSDNVQSLLDIGFIIAINLGLNTHNKVQRSKLRKNTIPRHLKENLQFRSINDVKNIYVG